MTRLTLLAVIGAIWLVMIAGTGVAAPFNLAAEATIKAAAALSLIEQTHGTHRSCRRGPVWRWGGVVRWHRHVGPASRPILC